MIVQEQIDSLKQRIAGADGISSLLRVLEDLQRLEPEQEGGEELDELRLRALDALARLTQEDPDEARPIILHHLLPLCLRAKGEWGVPRVLRHYDAALFAWLDRFPAIHRFSLRAAVLKVLAESLTGAEAERACRLVGKIGYRNEQVAGRLLDLARTGEDAIRDVGLRALSVLGVPPTRHAALVQVWIERTCAVPWNHDLIGAAMQLASTEILDTIFDQWLTPENLRDSATSLVHLAQFAIAIPAAIAEASPDDAELQDHVWERLRALEPLASDFFFFRVLGSTQVAHPCDSPGVVRYYLTRLVGDEHVRDLAYFRLEECDRPRQLLGWVDDPGTEVIQGVLQDATAANTMVGAWMTQSLRRKLHAWQTLLSLGRREALDHVSVAVSVERSGYAVGAVLDIAACFKLDPMPPIVRDLIAGDFGIIASNESERVSSHVSAIAVARASESQSALEALLGFNLIREEGVLISLLDALADTAAALIRGGDAGAAECLWHATAPGQQAHHRNAAAAALGRLLRRNLLRPLPADRLVALVEDETLDPYARRVLLEGLGYLPAKEVPPPVLLALRRALSASPAAVIGNVESGGADFRSVALASLARLGLLAEDPEALRRHLGLRLEGVTWRYGGSAPLPAYALT